MLRMAMGQNMSRPLGYLFGDVISLFERLSGCLLGYRGFESHGCGSLGYRPTLREDEATLSNLFEGFLKFLGLGF